MKTVKLVFAIAAFFVLIVPSYSSAQGELPYYNSPEFTPHWLEANSPELEDFHHIPSFSLSNQNGELITDKFFENKIFVANFFFSTCPGICPLVRSKLIKVQEKFIDDDDVFLLSHSIRPSTDTIEILKQYADSNGVKDSKWHLLTGDKAAIYSLAKTAYFANEDLGEEQGADDFLHTENVLLIDQNKHIRGIYNGLNSASMNDLITDIEILKQTLKMSQINSTK